MTLKTTDGMHALLVLTPDPEDTFWEERPEAPQAALDQALRLFPALSGLAVTVVLGSSHFAPTLQSNRWTIRTAHGRDNDTDWLPPGTTEILEQLPAMAPVLVADLRCLGITAHDASRLRNAWEQDSNAITIMAEMPQHHPCQQQRHFLIQHIGNLVIFDSWHNIHGVRVAKTRPFIVPAPTLDPKRNCGQSWNLSSLLNDAPQPEEDEAAALAAGRVVCTFGVDGRATALFPEKNLPPASNGAELCGISIAQTDTPEAIVERIDGRFLFRLTDSQQHSKECLSLHFVSEQKSFDLTYRADGPCELPSLPCAPGIPFTILREVRHGSTNYSTGVQQDLDLWRQHGCNIVNGTKSDVIHGRQAFPLCVQLAPGLCMGHAANLLAPSISDTSLVISSHGIGLVQNQVDYLRYIDRTQNTLQEPAFNLENTNEEGMLHAGT